MFETLPNYVVIDELEEEVLEAARTLMAMRYEYLSKKEDIHHEVSSAPSTSSSQQVSLPHQELFPKKRLKTKEKHHEKKIKQVKRNYTKRKLVEKNNTEEDLMFVNAWYERKLDPKEKIHKLFAMAEWFSEPMKKQVTESDVKKDQRRLMLGKLQVQENFLTLLKDSDHEVVQIHSKNGLDVLVYGPDGETHETMEFKMWQTGTPVLFGGGWNKFVDTNDLEANCDFLTIWMFRHVETRKICFAIHKERLPITSPLSRSTLKKIS